MKRIKTTAPTEAVLISEEALCELRHLLAAWQPPSNCGKAQVAGCVSSEPPSIIRAEREARTLWVKHPTRKRTERAVRKLATDPLATIALSSPVNRQR